MKRKLSEQLLRHYVEMAQSHPGLWEDVQRITARDLQDEHTVRKWAVRLKEVFGLPLSDGQVRQITAWLKRHPVSEKDVSIWKERLSRF